MAKVEEDLRKNKKLLDEQNNMNKDEVDWGEGRGERDINSPSSLLLLRQQT